MSYDSAAWGALAFALSTLLGVVTFFRWRSRGLAAGLRGAAWTLLPGRGLADRRAAAGLRRRRGVAHWAVHLVFSPVVWLGIVLTGVAVGALRSASALRCAAAPRAAGAVAAGTVARSGLGQAAPAAHPAGRRPGRHRGDPAQARDLLSRWTSAPNPPPATASRAGSPTPSPRSTTPPPRWSWSTWTPSTPTPTTSPAAPPARRSGSPRSRCASPRCSPRARPRRGSPACWPTPCARRCGWSTRASPTTSCSGTPPSTGARSGRAGAAEARAAAITLMVDDPAHLDLVDACRHRRGHGPVRVAIDIDAGLRLGPLPRRPEALAAARPRRGAALRPARARAGPASRWSG